MRASHLEILVLFSSLVSAVFATLLRETPRDRVRFAALVFAAFVLSAIVAGWVTAPFPN